LTQQIFCSAVSLQNQEALFGTATPTRTYLLLEYPHAWGANAIADSDLPEAVKSWLNAQAKYLPETKSLLIRGEANPAQTGIRFFVAIVQQQEPALYAFRLECYEDLLELDLFAILSGATDHDVKRIAGPLWLVCTHGRRDVCCARHGLPVYQALRETADELALEMIWQVSHVGGHRFAANLVCLPYGLLYGRVDPDNAQAILRATQKRQIYLPNLRGRSCYPQVVQAAEYHLRAQSGELALDAFHLEHTAEVAPGSWYVQFASVTGKTTYRLSLDLEDSGVSVYQGCKLDKKETVVNYRLRNYAILEGIG
jgi:hypothetical protein